MAGVSGISIMLAPAASAAPHPPSAMLANAAYMATRLDEHAVSTVTAGPLRPNMNDNLPAATASDKLPVAE